MMPSLDQQRQRWNKWNAVDRNDWQNVWDVSRRQAAIVTDWLRGLNRSDSKIIDVGCGTGWFSSTLPKFGRVTATDLSDSAIENARHRAPNVNFVVGDFMELDLGVGAFDVAISLEVLSHVADQPAFVARIASLLRPGGKLMLATQNRFVLKHFNDIPPNEGYLRHWVNKRELRALLRPHFEVEKLYSVSPRGNRNIMRIINSRKLNRPFKALFGDRMIEGLKEKAGLGFTLMALATKR
jgi:2-polyprenyl-3-methyl-5-hydroxy-6-metoxy-1,4-benzoquinol methylase